MLLTLLFLRQKGSVMLLGTLGFIALYPVMMMVIDYETGWNFESLSYADFWSPKGFVRNLFYNGFHPVIPWTAFMIFGLWYGRQDLRDDRFVKKSFVLGLLLFVSIQLISNVSLQIFSEGNVEAYEQLQPILGTSPMPPLPLYMLNGIAISIVVIAACILLARRYEQHFLIKTLVKTGQLALTFYVAHVVLGMGFVEELGTKKLGEYSIQFSVLYALFFSLACIVFAEIWLRFKKSGPLEWLLRKITA
jgi:uncharacterized membrane protein YeiB